MTSPHIEAIARAVRGLSYGELSQTQAEEIATLAFTMSAEICGNEIATLRELLNKQNVAIDISNEVSIYQICEAALRALIQKEVG